MNRVLDFTKDGVVSVVRKFFKCILVAVSTIGFSFNVLASETLVDSYGLLPKARSLVISPGGKYFAYIKREGNTDYVVVLDAKTLKYVSGLNASRVKARSVEFLTDTHLVLKASKTQYHYAYSSKWESSAAFVYNLETGKLKHLLAKSKKIHSAQSGLGRIVGVNADANLVYMPAFSSQTESPSYNLYRVNLDSGRPKLHSKGRNTTRDWFVNSDGETLAREDYDQDSKKHEIYSRKTGKWELIYSEKTEIPSIAFQGLSAGGESLLFIDDLKDGDAIFSMDLSDGTISAPMFQRDEQDVDGMITDENRRFLSVRYSGFLPEYEFNNDALTQLLQRMSSVFPMAAIDYVSATKDHSKVIFKVSGVDAPNLYVEYDSAKNKLRSLLSEYPQVSRQDIGSLSAVKFTARDGRKIPSIITYPPGKEKETELPLIVLPHGGPESYDYIQFDWWAQFLAAKGYLVVQPNFRGSSGFGEAHLMAGRGEWGRKMQDDVSDVVQSLIDRKYVDSNRVCIMGASYGGYSALAGGAFTPELYRCVISINGVADLPFMLRQEARLMGSKQWVISYWNELIGDSETELQKLVDISPVNFAKDFQAPVLLIHGDDDTVVSIEQSRRMEEALKAVEKEVSFVILKDEDHWLSTSRARLKMLKTIDQFLLVHNPPG